MNSIFYHKFRVKIRRISQITFFILFVGFLWRAIYPLQSITGARVLFAVDPLLAVGVSLAQRMFLPIFLFSVIMLIMTAVLGRFFCGWICPTGLMIDIAGYIRGIFVKVSKKELYNASLRYIKFLLLSGMIFFAIIGIQVVWWGDPVTIAGRFISMNLIPFIVNLTEVFFQVVLKLTNFPEVVLSFYRSINTIIGGVRSEYFPTAMDIFAFWLGIILLTAFSRRFWCRAVCPLGAMLAVAAKVSPFRRIVTSACAKCKKCVSSCRMGAIKSDNSYNKEECILCMDCIYDCPVNATVFSFNKRIRNSELPDSSRRSFLKFAGLSFLAMLSGCLKRNNRDVGLESFKEGIIRPPGALKEKDFVNRCIRCGNCMRVCVTNGLQPVITGAGLAGVWTPVLVPEIGECEYQCTMCGKVCPTGAIPRLELRVKKRTRLGTASVYRDRCISWRQEDHCIVCEEHCPVENKAIKIIEGELNGEVLLKPIVDKGLCIGCGTCQRVCPARPVRAILVNPSTADRV